MMSLDMECYDNFTHWQWRGSISVNEFLLIKIAVCKWSFCIINIPINIITLPFMESVVNKCST